MRRSCGFLLVSLVVATHAAAQAPSPATSSPQFEVASVKPNTSDGPSNYWQISGRRFMGNKSQIAQLIRMAWGDMQLRTEGAPDWVDAERYDVIANSPIDIVPGAPALSQMMRALLAERFKLAAHKETREQQIYALVMARPDRSFGPKLESAIPECPLTNGATIQPGVCGPGVDPGRMKWGNTSMAGLALNLSRQSGRRVIDETGLSGGYKVDLEYTPQRLNAAPPAPGQVEAPLPDGPTLFDALQQQLGLRLESRRGSIEVLVIDHIERPTPD